VEKPSKLNELFESGYVDTGKRRKTIKKGECFEFPVYALPGDIAGLVYNYNEDKIEMVYNMHRPFVPGEKKDVSYGQKGE